MGAWKMNLWVYDQDFVLKGGISSYKYLSWQEEYQNRGVFTLITGDTTKNVAMLQEEFFVYMKGKKTAMVIKYREFDSKTSSITVSGYTTLELIDKRFLLGTFNFTNAETGMRTIWTNNLRSLPDIRLGDLKGFTETVDSQYTNKLFLEIFPEVCATSGLGIRMLFDYVNKRHVLDIYKGVNRSINQTTNTPATFSDEWGSLGDVTIIDDKSVFKNVAYVFGQGEGTARMYVIVGTATGRNRFELPIDARDLQWQDDPSAENYQTQAQYLNTLRARGIAKLNEHNQLVSFKSEITALKDFGVKYDLGDIVTCSSQRYQMQLTTRITGFEHRIEKNVSKIYLILGEPTITAIGEMRLWLS